MSDAQVLGNWRHIGNGVARNTLRPEFYGCWQCCQDANAGGRSYASKMRSTAGVKDHIKLLHGGFTSKTSAGGNKNKNNVSNSDDDSSDSDGGPVRAVTTAANNRARGGGGAQQQQQSMNNSGALSSNEGGSNDGGAGANSSDTDLSGDSFSQSTGSGSSLSGLAGAKKSTLPCGMTMPVMMCILIMVPIIFLVVYTGIPTGEAVASQAILSDHKSIIDDLLFICARVQEERRDASVYLSVAPNSTTSAEMLASMKGFRQQASDRAVAMATKMYDSDLQGRKNFLDEIQSLFERLFRERQKIDDRQVTGPAMLKYLLTVVEQLFEMILWIGKDTRGEPLETRMINFVNLRRLTNSVGIIRSLGTALILRDGFDDENVELVYAMRLAYTRDLAYARTCGSPSVQDYINAWVNDPRTTAFWELADKLENGNPAIWANMTVDGFLAVANDYVNLLNSNENIVLDVITNGKILNEIAVTEGMKMFGGVFACILATITVIYYNKREQARLERALDNSATLAAAVQRFVPRHQLKTMGVRSITQVTPGMSTEVAQTVIFSSIRGFSTLAESMTRGDLFEWLQSFVEKMTHVVAEERSYISNFMGDGLMIISTQPTNGVNAVIKMHVAVDTLNLELIADGGTRPIEIGCGIHYGVCVAGVFGDETRLTCTFVAPDVNLASRLDRLTHVFGCKIVASQSVLDNISASLFAHRKIGSLQVFGNAMPIYDIFQADDLKVKQFKEATKDKFEYAVNTEEKDTAEAATQLWDQLAFRAGSSGVSDKAVQNRIEIRKTLAALAHDDNAGGGSKRRSRSPQAAQQQNQQQSPSQQQNANSSPKNSKKGGNKKDKNNNNFENSNRDGGQQQQDQSALYGDLGDDSAKINNNNQQQQPRVDPLLAGIKRSNGVQNAGGGGAAGMNAWRKAFKLK